MAGKLDISSALRGRKSTKERIESFCFWHDSDAESSLPVPTGAGIVDTWMKSNYRKKNRKLVWKEERSRYLGCDEYLNELMRSPS